MTTPITDLTLLNLTEEQAEEIYAQGQEAVIWALLKLSVLAQARAAARETSKPSSQVAPYEKPAAKKDAKKRGQKKGHKGEHRRAPLVIDRREEHSLDCCPECGGPVGSACDERRRVIEDIEKSTVVTTEHTIHAHYCPRCKKRVERRVTDALPKSAIGNRALVLSSWFHYGLGQTVSQVVSVFDSLFHLPVSAGGFALQWQRLADILAPWYDAIVREAQDSAVLNVDETGWRVNGKTHWLWCFTNPTATCYVIDPSRSGEVPSRILAECFEGTLVTDFFGAYNAILADRQLCLAHLLRELVKVSKTNSTQQWLAFEKVLKRLLKDAIRLSRREDRAAPDYARKVALIHNRLDELVEGAGWSDADAARLVKRLAKYRHSLLTFLDNPQVPFDNNRAERELRPAVIARKNSFHNTSQRGAATQSILMTIYRTLKLRGRDPIETLADALRMFIASGNLPALPDPHPPSLEPSG